MINKIMQKALRNNDYCSCGVTSNKRLRVERALKKSEGCIGAIGVCRARWIVVSREFAEIST
jgi:hypothetical protein